MTRIKLAALCAGLATVFAFGEARAESPQVCANYATASIKQQAVNLQQQCGLTGLGFSGDIGAHLAFCAIATKAQLEHEFIVRKNALAACAAQKQPEQPVQPQLQVEYMFKEPKIGGWRLDWCKFTADQCGAPAAVAFCQTQGHAKTNGFALAKGIGTFAPTKIIGNGQVCNGPNCDGFAWIKCKD
jgi:hypothetical protein